MRTPGFSATLQKLRVGSVALITGFCLLICVCTAIGQGASQKTAATFQDFLKACGYSPLQLEPDNGHLFIRGKMGAKKCRFLVDTGCSLTAVDPELAPGLKTLKELNVKYDDPFVRRFDPATIVLIPTIKFGSGEFRSQPARVHTTEFEYMPSVDRALLGSDFLNRNYALVDYLDAKLWVRVSEPPPSVKTALEDTLRKSGFAEVSLTLDFRPGVSLKSTIDGHECRLAVDSGAAWTILDREQVKPWGLKYVSRPRELNIVGLGTIGEHGVHEAQIGHFELGTLSVTNMYVGIADMSAWRISSSNVCGLIGAEMLATHGALIDYSSRKLWLRRRETKY